jgi:hypothetical protein|tara:strand:+ start:16965 stop:17156 length:192 start_codon:yes stop_codon:yes gene_type:complete
MIYLFQTKEGLIGKAQKGKDKFWEIQINGKPYHWFGGTVADMKRMVCKDYPNATFRKVSARGK